VKSEGGISGSHQQLDCIQLVEKYEYVNWEEFVRRRWWLTRGATVAFTSSASRTPQGAQERSTSRIRICSVTAKLTGLHEIRDDYEDYCRLKRDAMESDDY
jgi:hypothetical protein